MYSSPIVFDSFSEYSTSSLCLVQSKEESAKNLANEALAARDMSMLIEFSFETD